MNILLKDEAANCSSENLNSICEKFLLKFHYSTLQIQDSSVSPTKAVFKIYCDFLLAEVLEATIDLTVI